jgi:hypothetical protein
MPNPQSPTRPLASSTDASMHFMVRGASRPTATAEVQDVHGQSTLFVRLESDDDRRGGARHTTRLAIIGPRTDVAALIAELAYATEHAANPPTT